MSEVHSRPPAAQPDAAVHAESCPDLYSPDCDGSSVPQPSHFKDSPSLVGVRSPMMLSTSGTVPHTFVLGNSKSSSIPVAIVEHANADDNASTTGRDNRLSSSTNHELQQMTSQITADSSLPTSTTMAHSKLRSNWEPTGGGLVPASPAVQPGAAAVGSPCNSQRNGSRLSPPGKQQVTPEAIMPEATLQLPPRVNRPSLQLHISPVLDHARSHASPQTSPAPLRAAVQPLQQQRPTPTPTSECCDGVPVTAPRMHDRRSYARFSAVPPSLPPVHRFAREHRGGRETAPDGSGGGEAAVQPASEALITRVDSAFAEYVQNESRSADALTAASDRIASYVDEEAHLIEDELAGAALAAAGAAPSAGEQRGSLSGKFFTTRSHAYGSDADDDKSESVSSEGRGDATHPTSRRNASPQSPGSPSSSSRGPDNVDAAATASSPALSPRWEPPLRPSDAQRLFQEYMKNSRKAFLDHFYSSRTSAVGSRSSAFSGSSTDEASLSTDRIAYASSFRPHPPHTTATSVVDYNRIWCPEGEAAVAACVSPQPVLRERRRAATAAAASSTSGMKNDQSHTSVPATHSLNGNDAGGVAGGELVPPTISALKNLAAMTYGPFVWGSRRDQCLWITRKLSDAMRAADLATMLRVLLTFMHLMHYGSTDVVEVLYENQDELRATVRGQLAVLAGVDSPLLSLIHMFYGFVMSMVDFLYSVMSTHAEGCPEGARCIHAKGQRTAATAAAASPPRQTESGPGDATPERSPFLSGNVLQPGSYEHHLQCFSPEQCSTYLMASFEILSGATAVQHLDLRPNRMSPLEEFTVATYVVTVRAVFSSVATVLEGFLSIHNNACFAAEGLTAAEQLRRVQMWSLAIVNYETSVRRLSSFFSWVASLHLRVRIRIPRLRPLPNSFAATLKSRLLKAYEGTLHAEAVTAALHQPDGVKGVQDDTVARAAGEDPLASTAVSTAAAATAATSSPQPATTTTVTTSTAPAMASRVTAPPPSCPVEYRAVATDAAPFTEGDYCLDCEQPLPGSLSSSPMTSHSHFADMPPHYCFKRHRHHPHCSPRPQLAHSYEEENDDEDADAKGIVTVYSEQELSALEAASYVKSKSGDKLLRIQEALPTYTGSGNTPRAWACSQDRDYLLIDGSTQGATKAGETGFTTNRSITTLSVDGATRDTALLGSVATSHSPLPVDLSHDFYNADPAQCSMDSSTGSEADLSQLIRRRREQTFMVLADDVEVSCAHDTSRFRVFQNQVLGRGSFGVVYKCWDDVRGSFLACKEVTLDPDTTSEGKTMTALFREYNLLTSLRHPNIVGVVGFIVEGDRGRILMEWMPSGSLQSVLELLQEGLRESVVRRFLCDALQGLDFLHSKGIIHRDVKPGNMLIGGSGVLKLTDFGSSRSIFRGGGGGGTSSEATLNTFSMVGTLAYIAPDAVRGFYSAAADIWSLGCSAIHMATGRPPWSEVRLESVGLIFKIGTLTEEDHMPVIVNKDRLSPALLDFVSRALTFDRHKRPTARQLLEHPFITGLDASAKTTERR